MSKSKKLRKRLTKFVNSLGPDEAREQLLLAYLQMERCLQVLRGEDVEPVTMADNGESSDLELFYRCKKASEELAYLNEELLHLKAEDFLKENSKPGGVTIVAKVEASDQIQRLKNMAESFRELGLVMQPCQLTTGEDVFFLSKGRIHKSILENFIVNGECGEVICKVKGHENAIPASDLYNSAVRVASTVGKNVNNHVSVSSDHESAFFIDSTSRVFKAAKWYLEEQGIKYFDTINDLRKFLLENIIEDGKQGK